MYANALPLGKPFHKGAYVEEKLKVLSHMCITLTKGELQTLNTMQTPRQIDSFVRTIINNHWN